MLLQPPTILGAADMAGARRRLGVIAQGFGLTTAEINAAIDDPAGAERARRLHQSAQAFNIASTPSFVINGQRYQGPLSPRALAQALNAAGAAP